MTGKGWPRETPHSTKGFWNFKQAQVLRVGYHGQRSKMEFGVCNVIATFSWCPGNGRAGCARKFATNDWTPPDGPRCTSLLMLSGAPWTISQPGKVGDEHLNVPKCKKVVEKTFGAKGIKDLCYTNQYCRYVTGKDYYKNEHTAWVSL